MSVVDEVDLSSRENLYFLLTNNQGAGKIILYDDKLKVIMETDDIVQNLTIGSLELYFSLNDKSDYPLFNPIEGDDLIEWLEKQVSIDYIKQLGYELERVETRWQDGGILYQIKNTDIQLLIGRPDMEETIYAFSAPVSVVLQECIGKESELVTKDGFVCQGDGPLDTLFPPFDFLYCNMNLLYRIKFKNASILKKRLKRRGKNGIMSSWIKLNLPMETRFAGKEKRFGSKGNQSVIEKNEI